MKLNFGCGNKRLIRYYNVDIIKGSRIDKSFDFDKFPYPLEDSIFEYILLDQVLEHCMYPKKVLNELKRISKNNGIIEIKSPYVNSRTSLCELDHCSQFSRWSFSALNSEWDSDKNEGKFKIIKIESNPHRYLRWMSVLLLNLLSSGLNGIYVDIRVILKVVNKNIS